MRDEYAMKPTYNGEYNGAYTEGAVVPWYSDCVFGCNVFVDCAPTGVMRVTAKSKLREGNCIVTRSNLYQPPQLKD